MPRVHSPVLARRARAPRNVVWRTAAIAPPRPRDLAAHHLSLPRGPWTPAELLLDLLLEGWGSEKGEEGPDTRRNVEVQFWVDCEVASDDPDSIFADPPTFTLKVTVAPVLFIKPVTVTLDTWTGVDAEAPGAPLWLKQLVDARGVNTPKTFVRLYTWIRFFVQEMFAMPNLTIPHATSWFEIWTLVEHIQRLYATVPRAMSTGPKPKPRPTRVTMRTLVNVFEGLSLADDGEGVGSSMDTSS